MEDFNWFDQEPKSKGQETKLRIIKAAIKLFSAHGISSVTLKDLAASSRTSHPLILKHFGDKEGLFLAVRKYVTYLNHLYVDSRVKPEMDGRTRLFTFVYENINWTFHNKDEGKIILLTYYYSSLGKKKKLISFEARSLGVQRVLQHLMQADREGLVSSDEKLTFIAEAIHEYGVGLVIKILTSPQDTKSLPTHYKRKLNMYLDLFLV